MVKCMGSKQPMHDPERIERGGHYWLLKLRQMGTQGVHIKGVLPCLFRWANHAGTKDFFPILAALDGPVQNIVFLLFHFFCPHRPASWAGSHAASPVFEYVSVVRTYLVEGKYHREGRVLSFSPVVGIGTPPTPHPPASVPPPLWFRGERHIRRRERGWKSPNSNEGTYTVVLSIYMYFVGSMEDDREDPGLSSVSIISQCSVAMAHYKFPFVQGGREYNRTLSTAPPSITYCTV